MHALLLAFIISFPSFAQKDKKQDFSIDSFKWEKKDYKVDGQKAFDDPYLALKKLVGGNKRFMDGKNLSPRQTMATVRELDTYQKPFATIVGCSDSRVPNEIIFDQGVGDLFIIRTAGQVSAEASYGSMEYAAKNLGTKLLVVLGHTECGAVTAAVKRPKDIVGHVNTLINAIKPSVAKCEGKKGNLVNHAVRQNVIDQVDHLRDLEPVLHKLYTKGELLIIGGVYNISTGEVEFLPETLKDLPVLKK